MTHSFALKRLRLIALTMVALLIVLTSACNRDQDRHLEAAADEDLKARAHENDAVVPRESMPAPGDASAPSAGPPSVLDPNAQTAGSGATVPGDTKASVSLAEEITCADSTAPGCESAAAAGAKK